MMQMLKDYGRVHFIGIGGVGMSAIASVLIGRGFRVSGSDLVGAGPACDRLRREGAKIFKGHAPANIEGADLVVLSSAIRPDNPERRAAERAGVAIWRRARALAAIMDSGRGLAITGTHGKTTTTSMMTLVMMEAGLDPTALIGADLDAIGSNARLGRGEWVVAEADESDGSMLDLRPDRIILTNIDADHLDFYGDMEHLTESFAQFAEQLPPGGKLVACLDDAAVARIAETCRAEALTYAVGNRKAEMTARRIRHLRDGGVRFTAVFHGEELGAVRLRVPGRHYVSNALAVLRMGLDLGCEFGAMVRALGRYEGVSRRFQIKGASRGVTVIDDYAHHPTEIEATLGAARASVRGKKGRRIIGIFQPHRYTRTANLAARFGKSFRDADLLIVTDIYAAGEDPIDGVSGRSVYDRVAEAGHPDAHYIPTRAGISKFLGSRLRAGDILLTLGAGDIWQTGEDILRQLGESNGAASSTAAAPSAPVA